MEAGRSYPVVVCNLPRLLDKENDIPMRLLRPVLFTICGVLCGFWWPWAMLGMNVAPGKALYQQYCSVCHGPQGKGNGPAAAAMHPKPRDHTDGTYMNALSDAHLRKVIGQGGAAVGRSPLMPSWKTTLTPEQIGDVITYLRTLAVPAYKP
jgi:cytochrome c553